MRPVLEFFSSDEIYEIHQTSLEILERVGMKFESSEAQQILKNAGVEVDSKGHHATSDPGHHATSDPTTSSFP